MEYKNDLIKNNFVIINESDLVHKGKFSKFGKFWNNYLLSAKSKLLRFLKFFNFTNLFSYKLKQKEDIIYEDLIDANILTSFNAFILSFSFRSSSFTFFKAYLFVFY